MISDQDCPICLQKFNIDQNIPMLVCMSQHNVCKICLPGMKQKCPLCNNNFKSQSVYPNRIFLILLEKLKIQKEQKQKQQEKTPQIQQKSQRKEQPKDVTAQLKNLKLDLTTSLQLINERIDDLQKKSKQFQNKSNNHPDIIYPKQLLKKYKKLCRNCYGQVRLIMHDLPRQFKLCKQCDGRGLNLDEKDVFDRSLKCDQCHLSKASQLVHCRVCQGFGLDQNSK